MSIKKEIPFSTFLEYFPEVELPITLSDQSIHEISKVNKIFPGKILAQFFARWEGEINETMEFLPCCKLPDQKEFHTIIYWKANLLTYEFILATLNMKGELIQKKVIAGLISNGTTVMQSVAKIEDDLSIHIVIGEKKADQVDYDADNSTGHYMEILPNGTLISSQDDDILWQEKNIRNEN